MEPVYGTNEASKSASEEDEDVITRMPENVIIDILDRLPIWNAVGTSILSRNWRFKWTMLTRFEFSDIRRDYDRRIIISRLLIQLKGPITKFVLCTPLATGFDVDDVSHWVMILSGKGIKEFTLINFHETLKLPIHPFSCLDLKHLELYNCCFHSVPTFCGFPNLLSLELGKVTDIGDWVEFITKCPLIEILKIRCDKPIGKLKLVEIAKLKNLKELSLPLCMLDDVAITSSTIFQLAGYLQQLRVLALNFEECQFLAEGEKGTEKSVHTIFPCLETLSILHINLNNCSMLSYVIEMISGSPNLKSLTILVCYKDDVPTSPPHALTSSEADYNTLGQLKLHDLSFLGFKGSENEVCLIKYLLASSPLLNKAFVRPSYPSKMLYENLMFAAKLLKLRRASPLAEIKFNC